MAKNTFRWEYCGGPRIWFITIVLTSIIFMILDYVVIDLTQPNDEKQLQIKEVYQLYQDNKVKELIRELRNNNNLTALDGIWQTVAGTKFKFFVFSAYYDWRGSSMVRVIGTSTTSKHDKVTCLFWYNTSNTLNIIPIKGTVKIIREHWNMNYSACFVLCPLQFRYVPQSVSIISQSAEPPTNKLLINNANHGIRPKLTPPPNKLAVCVKPIYRAYNKPLRMLEFIEMYRLLGIHHFTFYNVSISSTISCILNHYIGEGRATVFPWKLDLVSQRDIRTEGIFAALNECLYRTMYRFSFVAMIDLDEIILPNYNITIQKLMKWLGKMHDTKSISSFIFKNAFFYLEWPDDLTLSDDPFERKLVILRKTTRRKILQKYTHRSKYICRPELVIEAGNHFIWEHIRGHKSLNVPSHLAMMNHYRDCESMDCAKLSSQIDRKTHRYKACLVERVKDKWNKLKTECSLPEIENAKN